MFTKIISTVLVLVAFATLSLNNISASAQVKSVVSDQQLIAEFEQNSQVSQELVKKADKYISYDKEGNAQIDSKVYKILKTQESHKVKTSVKEFNKKDKKSKLAKNIDLQKYGSASGCSLSRYSTWYGAYWYIPDCAVKNIVYYGTNASFLWALIGSICGFMSGACALAMGLGGIYAGWLIYNLDYQNNRCGHRGANLNVMYSTMWVSGRC